MLLIETIGNWLTLLQMLLKLARLLVHLNSRRRRPGGKGWSRPRRLAGATGQDLANEIRDLIEILLGIIQRLEDGEQSALTRALAGELWRVANNLEIQALAPLDSGVDEKARRCSAIRLMSQAEGSPARQRARAFIQGFLSDEDPKVAAVASYALRALDAADEAEHQHRLKGSEEDVPGTVDAGA